MLFNADDDNSHNDDYSDNHTGHRTPDRPAVRVVVVVVVVVVAVVVGIGVRVVAVGGRRDQEVTCETREKNRQIEEREKSKAFRKQMFTVFFKISSFDLKKGGFKKE